MNFLSLASFLYLPFLHSLVLYSLSKSSSSKVISIIHNIKAVKLHHKGMNNYHLMIISLVNYSDFSLDTSYLFNNDLLHFEGDQKGCLT